MPLTPEEVAAAESSTAPTHTGGSGQVWGGGNKQNSAVDLTNAWIRQQPWYQQWFQQQGLDPNNVKLSDGQRKQLAGVLKQHGLDLSNTDGMNIDPAGNINDPHGWASQPSWLKAVEIAAAATGIAFGGAAVLGAGAAPSGTAASSAIPTLAGTSTFAGAPAMLSGSIIPSTLGGGGVAGLTGGAATALAGGGGSTLSKIGGLVGKKGLSALSGIGTAIGAAGTAAGQNQLDQEKLGLEANAQNTEGQSAYETELMNRAKQETTQRSQANKDVYRANFFKNYTPSPYDPTGKPSFSPQLMDTLSAEGNQGVSKLSAPSQYDTTTMAPLPAYKPYVPKKPGSTLQTIGNWAGPVASTLGVLGSAV